VLDVTGDYDAQRERYALTVRQSCPPTPGQETKLPMHIPLAVGLVAPDGWDMLAEGTRVVSLKKTEERFAFDAHGGKPVPSLARNFSAPVIVRYDYSDADLALLAAHDTDPFNRWEAGQRLALRVILRAVDVRRSGQEYELDPTLVDATGRVLDISAVGARDPRDEQADALPLIRIDPSPGGLTPGTPIPGDDFQQAYDALVQLRALGLRVSEVDLKPATGITVTSDGGLRAILGTEDDLAKKVTLFKAIVPKIAAPENVVYVDLRSVRAPTVLYR